MESTQQKHLVFKWAMEPGAVLTCSSQHRSKSSVKQAWVGETGAPTGQAVGTEARRAGSCSAAPDAFQGSSQPCFPVTSLCEVQRQVSVFFLSREDQS